MKLCPYCGMENLDTMRFCTKDQTPLDGQAAPKASVDIVFCVDATSDMQYYINFLCKNALTFADEINAKEVNYKIALIEFHDLKIGEPIGIVVPLTESSAEFNNGLQNLRASGGGDVSESSLDALWMALELSGFRNNVPHYIVLITDAPPHDPDYNGRSLDDLIIRLKEGNQRILLVAPKVPAWEKIKSSLGTRAEHIPIVAGERLDFQVILDRIVKGAVVVAGLQR